MAKKTNVEESPKYKLNKEDMIKIGKGALIAVGGVVLPALIEGASVLLNYASDVIPKIDFGAYTSIAIIVSSVVINSLRKALQGAKL